MKAPTIGGLVRYTVTYKGGERSFTIKDVVQDGYIAVEGQSLPIRWFITKERVRHEVHIEPGGSFSFSKERAIAAEAPLAKESDDVGEE